MTKTAATYFTSQDFTASKAQRDAYVREADGNLSRALLAACIDMAALKAYVEDIEALAVQHGVSLEELMVARPVALDAPQRPHLSLV